MRHEGRSAALLGGGVAREGLPISIGMVRATRSRRKASSSALWESISIHAVNVERSFCTRFPSVTFKRAVRVLAGRLKGNDAQRTRTRLTARSCGTTWISAIARGLRRHTRLVHFHHHTPRFQGRDPAAERVGVQRISSKTDHIVESQSGIGHERCDVLYLIHLERQQLD